MRGVAGLELVVTIMGLGGSGGVASAEGAGASAGGDAGFSTSTGFVSAFSSGCALGVSSSSTGCDAGDGEIQGTRILTSFEKKPFGLWGEFPLARGFWGEGIAGNAGEEGCGEVESLVDASWVKSESEAIAGQP